MIPYGKQTIEDCDIEAVVAAIESDWLTTGPLVEQFEQQFAKRVHSQNAVAVSSGTAALHAAMFAAGIGEADEVIVPAISFVATANAVVFMNAKPVFADVDPETLLVCPASVREKITSRTRAIVAVDFAGQPCDYQALREIADEFGLTLIADACHSLGGAERERPVGSLADVNCFSFHPVKPITTCEGGMATTDSPQFTKRMRQFRNHGIETDFRTREKTQTHRYDMTELGFNYRLSDLQSAIGLSQLKRLDQFTQRRNEIANRYDQLIENLIGIEPLARRDDCRHAFHLYVIKVTPKFGPSRDELFDHLRANQIGGNVHYRPIYLNSFYRDRFGTKPGLCPQAESSYEQIISLPIFPSMTDADIETVFVAIELARRESKTHSTPQRTAA